MPDNNSNQPGDELLPDWSNVPVAKTPEPLGDPHDGEGEG
jgi:hypothetical protein